MIRTTVVSFTIVFVHQKLHKPIIGRIIGLNVTLNVAG